MKSVSEQLNTCMSFFKQGVFFICKAMYFIFFFCDFSYLRTVIILNLKSWIAKHIRIVTKIEIQRIPIYFQLHASKYINSLPKPLIST